LPPDAVIANAGVGAGAPLGSITEQQFDFISLGRVVAPQPVRVAVDQLTGCGKKNWPPAGRILAVSGEFRWPPPGGSHGRRHMMRMRVNEPVVLAAEATPTGPRLTVSFGV
jgi:hypothetical protein